MTASRASEILHEIDDVTFTRASALLGIGSAAPWMCSSCEVACRARTAPRDAFGYGPRTARLN